MADKPTVVITGSSRGIGAATALLAAQSGYAVCVNYLNSRSAADEVVGNIEGAGGRAIAGRADVGVKQDAAAMFDVAEDQLGPVSGLVNNAAILETQSNLAGISEERLERVLRTKWGVSGLVTKQVMGRRAVVAGGSVGAIVNGSIAYLVAAGTMRARGRVGDWVQRWIPGTVMVFLGLRLLWQEN